MNSKVIVKLRKIGKYIKILYVEDDNVISEELEKLLKKVFKNIDVAKDGKEGIELYRKTKYDIVITDIEMPNMNGIDMIKKIREINDKQIVVVTSAYKYPEYLLEFIDNSIEKFILKPFDINKLFISISKIVYNIYNEKKREQLEKQLDEKFKLNQILLDRMITPIVILNNNKIEYVNEKFEEMFVLDDFNKEMQDRSLCNILQDKNLSKMSNKEFIQYIGKENDIEKYIKLKTNKVERFKINITSVDNGDIKLVCFHNTEAIRLEIDNLQFDNQIDSLTSLFTRETFINQLDKVLGCEEQYDVVCFGLKNIKEFVRLFGVINLRDVYYKLGVNLKAHFKDDIANDNITLYYFDSNHYVALVKRDKRDGIKKLLKSFGYKFYYTNKLAKVYEPMYLDVLSLELDDNISSNKNMSEIVNRLYMLKEQI